MQAFRTSPPQTLGKVRIERVRDYRDQVVRSVAGAKIGDLKTTKGDLLFLDSANGPVQFSIAARPSGTEPKIKFYFFARTAPPSTASLADIKTKTVAEMHDFQESLMAWVNGVLKGSSRS